MKRQGKHEKRGYSPVGKRGAENMRGLVRTRGGYPRWSGSCYGLLRAGNHVVAECTAGYAARAKHTDTGRWVRRRAAAVVSCELCCGLCITGNHTYAERSGVGWGWGCCGWCATTAPARPTGAEPLPGVAAQGKREVPGRHLEGRATQYTVRWKPGVVGNFLDFVRLTATRAPHGGVAHCAARAASQPKST